MPPMAKKVSTLFSISNDHCQRMRENFCPVARALLNVKVSDVTNSAKGHQVGNEISKERSSPMTVKTNTKAGSTVWGG